jgi:protein-tyrosine phosphatase
VIDTHCHMLPGVDDGPEDDEAAVAMARVAVADGVKTVIVTPHMREGDFVNERPKVLERLEKFRALLAAEKIELDLRPGSEVHLAPRLVERILSGRLLTYGDQGTYLLLECPYRTRPVRLDETIFELKVAGITPVLAHPERIRFFQEDVARYEEMLRLGALGQMTTSSLLGTFGKAVKSLSDQLVRRRMVHVLGSDAHDVEYRPPKLLEACERWADLAGAESARHATEDIPLALVQGTPYDPLPPLPPERPKGLLERLFGRD